MTVKYHGQEASVKLDTAAVGIFPPADPTFTRGAIASLLITGRIVVEFDPGPFDITPSFRGR